MSLPDSHPGTRFNSQSEAALADQTPVARPEEDSPPPISETSTSHPPTVFNDQAVVAVVVNTRVSPITG